jgi:diaminopimelate epimerase
MVESDRFMVETPGGLMSVYLLDGGRVRASLGEPRLEPEQIPLRAQRRAPSYRLALDGEAVDVGAVSMGNPHAVLRVADVAAAPVARLGPAIQALADFPQGVNVGFMQVLAPDHVRLRVFERGVGETLACGSGACAAVVVGRVQKDLGARVRVSLPGGDLDIEWQGEGYEVVMEGPTATVFEGEVAA